MKTTRFDTAWEAALRLAGQTAASGPDVVLVRDLLGRISLLVDDRDDPLTADSAELTALREEFSAAIQPFVSGESVQAASAMFAPEMFLDSTELVVHSERQPGGAGQVGVLERTVVGADWSRDLDTDTSHSTERRDRRVALYGFKGGVGRSTATAILARHLASRDYCVLVVDLDLESPGVSSLLENPAGLPAHGIVDHLVEAAVGNEADLDLVTRSSVLPGIEGIGEVWLAPAIGKARDGEPYDYLAKLNRIYSDLPATGPGSQPRSFCTRLGNAIEACEDLVAERSRRPDVVLLDSRAGIHDIAAVTLTQLSGLALLFAVNNPSTWEGYGMLFKQWAKRPDRASELRTRLRIVAAMFHSAGDAKRLDALRDQAYEALSTSLYDEVRVEDEFAPDAPAPYHPAPLDGEAPHAPIPILFGNDLVGLDPHRSRDWLELPFIEAAYARFLTTLARLVPKRRTDTA
ncbi:KGGVGR-motif variant AAA ATPase [Streptomyces alboflavus]|uniref:KGGVGR-motif variant AAA ATPase n=1 Tax=Streptomyces alboflavus TaxID=67267 RepID=UPI0036CC871D